MEGTAADLMMSVADGWRHAALYTLPAIELLHSSECGDLLHAFADVEYLI